MVKNRYYSEDELLEAFEKSFIKAQGEKSKYLLLHEIKTNWGVVDLLAVFFNENRLAKRVKDLNGNIDLPPFTLPMAYAMVNLSQLKRTNINEIKKLLKLRNGSVKELLDSLVKRNLVWVYKNGVIRIRQFEKIFFVKDIRAFEAKLENWRRVISQAERHLWFTNKSYIVVPQRSNWVLQKMIAKCNEHGVGLILQRNDSPFEILADPINVGFHDPLIAWKLNELIVDLYLAKRTPLFNY